MPLRNAAARAKRYRLLAEEVRTAAEGMQTASRHDLLRIAETYETLAAQLERPGLPGSESDTG